jgi:DNA-binding transcriptional MerR regulator
VEVAYLWVEYLFPRRTEKRYRYYDEPIIEENIHILREIRKQMFFNNGAN